jgi:hypothetical protein
VHGGMLMVCSFKQLLLIFDFNAFLKINLLLDLISV